MFKIIGSQLTLIIMLSLTALSASATPKKLDGCVGYLDKALRNHYLHISAIPLDQTLDANDPNLVADFLEIKEKCSDEIFNLTINAMDFVLFGKEVENTPDQMCFIETYEAYLATALESMRQEGQDIPEDYSSFVQDIIQPLQDTKSCSKSFKKRILSKIKSPSKKHTHMG